MIAQLEATDLVDDDEAEEPEVDETIISRRFGLAVTNSRHGAKYGVWDGKEAAIIELFCTRDEAMTALAQIITEN